jgi:hypothetical protein
MNDFAEHGFGRRKLPAAREIAGEPSLGIEQCGGAGVIGVQQCNPLSIETLGVGRVVRILGDGGKVTENLRAHPQDRGDAAAADRFELGVGPAQRVARAGNVAGQAQGRPAQLQCLAVEDFDLLLREELVGLGAKLFADPGIVVEPLGGYGIDVETAFGAALDRLHGRNGKRLVELLERAFRIALVELVDRAIIAQTSRDDRIRSNLLSRP